MAKYHRTSHHARIEELEKQFKEDIESIGPILRYYDTIKQAREAILNPNTIEQNKYNNKTNE